MTFLVVRIPTGKKNEKRYEILSPSTYGMETWGDFHCQKSLEKSRKNWYIKTWYSGGDYYDDETYKVKLRVVFETSDSKELEKYIFSLKDNIEPEGVIDLLTQVKTIVNDEIDFSIHVLTEEIRRRDEPKHENWTSAPWSNL